MPSIVRLAMDTRSRMRDILAEWQAIVDHHGAHLTHGETRVRCWTEATPEAAAAWLAGDLTAPDPQ